MAVTALGGDAPLPDAAKTQERKNRALRSSAIELRSSRNVDGTTTPTTIKQVIIR